MSIFNPLVMLAIVIALAGAGASGYLGGHRAATRTLEAQYQAEKAAQAQTVSTALQAAIERVEAKYQQQLTTNRRTIDAYEKKLRDLERPVPLAGGLRVPATICAGLGPAAGATVAAGTGPVAGATTGTVALPERITADLQDLTLQCDRVAERLRALQGWIRESGLDGG